MMKKTLIGALVVALALIGTGCDSKVTLDSPTVAAEVADGGAILHLTWAEVTNAKSYEIKAGDSTYTTTSTSLDVTNPAATVEVRAVSGNSKSDSAVVNCKVVESTVEFYGDLNYVNPHSSGFGFATNGSADTFKLIGNDLSSLDFYADGKSSAGEMRLISAGNLNSSRKGNGIQAASGSYDDAKLAGSPGSYSSPLAVTVDSTYYLRISPDQDTIPTWSTDDHYAKAKVVSITSDSLKVTLKLGYQKIAGLRWLGN
jgi:hypothetical protein